MTASAPGIRLCTALAIEARALRGRHRAIEAQAQRARDQAVVVIGMRARRRDRLATLAAAGGPVALVGFGGGLHPAQRAGDVVVATEIRHPGGRLVLPGAPSLLARLRTAGVAASGGPIWCADHVVRGAQRAALASTGAVAVDMESAALADTCGAERLMVVRVLVDTPTRGLLLGCLLSGRRAYRTLRDVGTTLCRQDWSTRDGSITSGTVKTGATRND